MRIVCLRTAYHFYRIFYCFLFQKFPFCPPNKMKVLVTQSYLTLCDPMDCNPPGSSVHGILQARVLGWVAMPTCRCSHPMWLLMGHVLFHPGSEVTIEHVRGRRGTSTSRPSPAQLPGREQGPRSQDGLPRASLSLDLTLLHAQSEQRHSHLYRNASCRPSCPLQRQAAGT